ncbi:MAG: site-2 protease family protein [Clostridia bacterium]
MAKLAKVKVNEFAIGFGLRYGKGKEKKQICTSIIPLGGFVSMEGEEERSNARRVLLVASIPRRIAIVLAGGIVNIFWTSCIFCNSIFPSLSTGNTTEEGKYISNVVRRSSDDESESKDTLQVGDKILAINGKKIRIHNDLNKN